MISSIKEILDKTYENNAELRLATVTGRTYRDQGFNLKPLPNDQLPVISGQCYLHTRAARRGLIEGDRLLIAVVSSERQLGRMDVIAWMRDPEDLTDDFPILDNQELAVLLPVVFKELSELEWIAFWGGQLHKEASVLELKDLVTEAVWDSMVTALPPEYVPDFLGSVPPILHKLALYLECYAADIDDAQLVAIEDFLQKHRAISDALCMRTASGVRYPVSLGLSLSALDLDGFVTGLNKLPLVSGEVWFAIWSELQARSIEFIVSLKSNVNASTWSRVSEACSEEAIPSYLVVLEPGADKVWDLLVDSDSKNLTADVKRIQQYINNNPDIRSSLGELPLKMDDLPLAVQYFYPKEPQCWQFIVEQWDMATEEEKNSIREYVNLSGFVQAIFLLMLVDKRTAQESCSIGQICLAVDNMVKLLFDAHSGKRSHIERTIFLGCPVRKGFSACEVSVATNKHAGKQNEYTKKIEPEFNYWCRRSRCEAGECMVSTDTPKSDDIRLRVDFEPFGECPTTFEPSGYFYAMVKRYWGFSRKAFHSSDNGRFSRSLAAINRWNELLIRLHCRSCQKPLRISEHSPGSIMNMAYAVTYWHCGEVDCHDYARSVKLSHCLGSNCDKIIDNRDDRQACNPWEVRSHQKFYLCKKCGSCCHKHKKEGGYRVCPSCGLDYDASSMKFDGSHLTCSHCRHKITVPWNARDEVGLRFRSREKASESGSLNGEHDQNSLLIPQVFLSQKESGLARIPLQKSCTSLFVYDLFYCLKHGYIEDIQRYQQIYDVKVLERLIFLGKKHRRYHNGKKPEYGILLYLEEALGTTESGILSERTITYLDELLRRAEAIGVLDHYRTVELPFTLSLYTLVGKGIQFDMSRLMNFSEKVEIQRNVVVESLRIKGIDTPTRVALKAWLPDLDNELDIDNLLERIDTVNFKAIRHLAPEFDAIYTVEKLERTGRSIKAMAETRGRFIPDYQVVGTDTLRCTSRRPNILSFPKQLRPLIKAGNGRCIVECDFSQMDVGVVAGLSNDETLIGDYNNGDVYSGLASRLGIDRDTSKMVFLGILYGVENSTLGMWLSLSKADAGALVSGFYDCYPVLKNYLDEQVRHGTKYDYVQCIGGIRRSVGKSNHNSQFDNESVLRWERNWFRNFPVQASSSIIFKRAIIDVAENVFKEEFKLIAPLYDAIVFEVPIRRKEHYVELVTSSMKRAMSSCFPVLQARVKVNESDTSCWNGGVSVLRISDF